MENYLLHRTPVKKKRYRPEVYLMTIFGCL